MTEIITNVNHVKALGGEKTAHSPVEIVNQTSVSKTMAHVQLAAMKVSGVECASIHANISVVMPVSVILENVRYASQIYGD